MDKTGCIAVLNAGSSSIKFAIYDAHDDGTELFHGQVEGIGTSPRRWRHAGHLADGGWRS